MVLKLFKSLFPFKIKRKIKEHLGVPSLHWSLKNLKSKGYNPNYLIDIGAYEGSFTLDFLEVFPNVKVLMLEAQDSKKSIMTSESEKNKNIEFEIAVLSSEDNKEISFFENETASHVEAGTFVDLDFDKSSTKKTKTLDTILKNRNFSAPIFLKIDVQGHELEVLNGAAKTLNKVEICLLEVSFLDLGFKTPLAIEIINFMEQKHFQMYDITQFMRRPYDKALYQIDLIFVNKDSSIISNNNWN